ncbi:endonuclease dU [Methanococcus sp. CF]
MGYKDEIGVIGIDDAPFNRSDKEALIVGTYMRGNKIVDEILFKKIEKDGFDSTEKILKIVKDKHFTKINAIFLDGVTFGGFNIADIVKIYNETKIPVIAIMEKEPDVLKMKSALKKYFFAFPEKIEILESFPKPEPFENIFIQYIGINFEDACKLIKKTRLRSKIPECLRISHIVGRGFLNME